MQRWVSVVLVSLVASPAFAQQTVDTKAEAAAANARTVAACATVTPDEWVTWTDAQRRACPGRFAAATTSAQPATRTQKVKTGERVSVPLALTGLATMAVGGLMMLPHGEEYHILGSTYCVSGYYNYSYHDVDKGTCNNPATVVKAGAVVLGVGAVMTWAGARSKTRTIQVAVNPHTKTYGASASVQWR